MNFVSKLPWPGDCAASPINPGTDWLRGQKEILPCIRLGFAPGLDRDFLMLAAQKSERIYVADFTLPERNLALPMHFLARLCLAGAISGAMGLSGALLPRLALSLFMKKSFLVEQAFWLVLKNITRPICKIQDNFQQS